MVCVVFRMPRAQADVHSAHIVVMSESPKCDQYRFESKQEAEEEIHAIMAEESMALGWHLEAPQCPICAAWHLLPVRDQKS